MNYRNRSVDVHQFAMVPRADIPRSSFRMQWALKTTFDAGWLIPVLCEEVLPGDTFNCRMTAFCRMATPIFPFMDNLYMDSFFFFVPNRLVWANWQKFMGEQTNPGDSIDYVIPKMTCPADGYDPLSIYDMFGLPTKGQINVTGQYTHSALPLRAYNLIWNQWFRDENLQNSLTVPTDDGPDSTAYYALRRRGKRHDYFTSALPFVQKGPSATLPLGTTAPVIPASTHAVPTFWNSSANLSAGALLNAAGAVSPVGTSNITTPSVQMGWNNPNLIADLSTATAATINQLRQSFQIQKLLERDARGGTRYTEIVRSHFGVVSPDARLQRPEYLGGGTNPIQINPIAQTSGTSVTGSDTPLGNLAAFGTALSHNHGFTQSFVEHGYVIGLVSVRADLTYQQGLRRHWSRNSRYDFYFPVFAMLGEQAIYNKEIFCQGDSTIDNQVFGYQERWAEYRYGVGQINGLFRSTTTGTIDAWHLAQRFTALPTLNDTFIQETPPLERVLAVGSDAGGQQFLCDAFFDMKAARPLPLYSVPGLVDHF